MTNALTRITVIGERRHLDLRLPSDEPVASLIPQIRDLLFADVEDARERPAPTVLTTAVGVVIEGSQSLRSATIPDGARLYLRDKRAIPPSPEVYDVASFAAESTGRSPGLWAGALRTVGLASVAGLLIAGSGSAAVLFQHPGARTPFGIVLVTALLLAGSLLGRFWSVPAGLAVLVAGWMVGVSVAITAGGIAPGALLLCATVLALAAGGLGTRQHIPFFAAAALLAVLGALWVLAQLSTRDAALAAAVTGIVSVLTLGLAPRLATVVAGLSGLDDDQRQGVRPDRQGTLDSFHMAHRTLAGWSLVSAVMASVAATVICLAWDRAVWGLLLAAALLGSVVFRGLSLPLFWQRAGVYAAAAGGLLATTIVVSLHFQQPACLLITGVVGVLVLAAAQGTVRAQTGARLRVLAARAEMICVLATIPLALGLSGTYTQLGQTFG
ncbi:EsaB/YukD family protein [Micrococcaceae bacterium Sec5.7]